MKTGIADPSEGSNQEELIREITAGQSVEASRLIRRAWEVKKQATAAGNAGDGAGDYLRVVHILRTLNMDREIIAAAMLYDLMADDRFHPDEIRSEFGESVAHLAEGLTRMSRIGELRGDESDLEERPARLEGLRKLLLAMAEDLRVVIVKLAERLHGMRTLIRKKDDVWRRRVAAETLEIYAPLANRLGIWHIKWELEDLAFRCLEPMRYREIAANLDERRQDRELFISEVVSTLLTELAAQGIRAEVNGRPKHIYSIWKKMKRKGLAFNELYDVRAVRILTESVGDCYAVLGVVHGLWPHLPREFDDYITNPKGNSYRSLHTAVIGPGGRTLEVQIRTQEMHRHAEMGVAAHWRYKEGGKQEHSYDSKIAWLRQILQLNDEPGDDDDFLERFKTEVFQDRVYALSPRGRVVDLPRGATPLDFAYTIHSEVGNRCRGAKVDDSIVPLTYELQNGDQVEILTARNGTPSRDWLNSSLGYLKTSRARSKVRQWFKQQDLEINLAEGRDLLDRELRRLGVTDVNLDGLARRLKYPRLDGLLSAIGRGEVSSAQIAGAVREQLLPRDVSVPEMVKPPVRETGNRGGDVTIEGVGNLMTHMGGCCKPAPPDPIVGYITRGHGITIHRQDCSNVFQMGEEDRPRLLEVSWSMGVNSIFPVDVYIQAYNRQGMLRDVTTLLASEKVNLLGINTHSDKEEYIAHIDLTVGVPDVRTLSRLLGLLSQLPNVLEVRRKGSRQIRRMR